MDLICNTVRNGLCGAQPFTAPPGSRIYLIRVEDVRQPLPLPEYILNPVILCLSWCYFLLMKSFSPFIHPFFLCLTTSLDFIQIFRVVLYPETACDCRTGTELSLYKGESTEAERSLTSWLSSIILPLIIYRCRPERFEVNSQKTPCCLKACYLGLKGTLL